jgi:GTP-binding protein
MQAGGIILKLNYNKAEYIASYGKFSQIPASERIEIAFAGHSNVGKSTLINKLFNRKNLARVSSVPGKTATINFYGLENLYFVDLPGYGYAKVAKSEKERWSGLIEGYLGSDRDIRLVFMLVDMRHAPTKDDVKMIDYLIDTETPFVLVLTKADKLKKTEREKRMEAFKSEIPCFEDIHVIPFSSMTFEGVEELREIVEEIADDGEETEE